MSFYTPIDRRINADRWFKGLPKLAQLLWFRLLTGPHVTQVAGLWPATEDGLAKVFGFKKTEFRKLFTILSTTDGRPNGKVFADWDAGVLWFPNAIHIPSNQPKNENTLRGWIKHLELVPECELRDLALQEIADWVKSMPKRFPEGLPKGFPEPLRKPVTESFREHVPRAKQEQEQEHEQEQEQETLPRPQRFPMSPNWRPSADTIAAFRVGLIPDWAIDELVGRWRAHFVADQSQKRTETEWNQSCSKWVFGDWSDSRKRPKSPGSHSQPKDPMSYGNPEGWST